MFSVDRFTAILNPPQIGILSVGRVQKRVVPDEADQPAVRPVITTTLSAAIE
jgi:pyruvate dehydrogenase E2 component (dihydrolipoamide acetyltransferase)